MDNRVYRVDPKLIPPTVAAMISGALLLILEGTTGKGVLLFFLLAPFYYLGAEVLTRVIILRPNGLEIKKLLRTIEITWSEIRSLDAVVSGKKVFLILTHEKARPILITNTIHYFKDIATGIMENLPASKVTEEARRILADPPTKWTPVIQAWLVCITLTALWIGALLGYGRSPGF
jgi:hypothetical protein